MRSYWGLKKSDTRLIIGNNCHKEGIDEDLSLSIRKHIDVGFPTKHVSLPEDKILSLAYFRFDLFFFIIVVNLNLQICNL